jgi:hypothetical protein
MRNDEETFVAASDGRLILRFSGGKADAGMLSLSSYKTSLTGWEEFFRIAAGLLQKSAGDVRNVPLNRAIRIDVEAERKGSYEVVIWIGLAIAGGIVGNRADAATVWTYRKLRAWFKRLIVGHVSAKRTTTNVDEIVAALEAIAQSQNVMLVPDEEPREEDGGLLVPEEPEVTDPAGSKRALVERIDTALKSATQPLDEECKKIELFDEQGSGVASLGANERRALSTALTLPPPEGVWRRILVRFERINRKTGRALIYVGRSTTPSATAQYARIVDPAVHVASNVYMEAFSADAPLEVWARQVRGEKGRLNLMWEITADAPEQLALFGPAGSRA